MRPQTISLMGIILPIITFGSLSQATWNLTAKNNVMLYWGQNGVANFDAKAGQKPLLHFCQDPNVDLISIAFVHSWGPKVGKHPLINLSNACIGFETFNGTDLLKCPTISVDIRECQKRYKKKILISLGGGAPAYQGFSTKEDAYKFGKQIWKMFGPDLSYAFRPFGNATVDGFDLDFEHGTATNYDRVALQLRDLMNKDSKKTGKQWLLTAAPQCPIPDENLDTALTSVPFDAIFVQFYNNPGCDARGEFNFARWDDFAKTKSKNHELKVFMALPMNEGIPGYINSTQAADKIADITKTYTSFGGLAGWDASMADLDPEYIPTVKEALNAGSGHKGGIGHYQHKRTHHGRRYR